MAITSLPAPPSRSDPENFAERADAFMAALPQFADQANTLQTEVNQTAESVDNDAIAAAASSAYSADRAASAATSANTATTAQQAASQKATDAASSAGLAEQWATKLGAPVIGDRFSAKHYAQLAAQGAGLSVVFADSVPTEDIGPVFIVGQGIAEWDEGKGAYHAVLNAAVQSLAVDVEAIKNGSLLEVGINNLGMYHKYASGDMVCYLRMAINFTGAVWTAGTNLAFYEITNITFPAAFISQPSLHSMYASDGLVSARSAYVSATTSIQATRIGSTWLATPNQDNPSQGGTITVTGIAVGKWKL